MSKQTIHMLITWCIFSVAAGLLCEAIKDISWELLPRYALRTPRLDEGLLLHASLDLRVLVGAAGSHRLLCGGLVRRTA
jgi:hypothetical protein